jgi:hypothetical protein
MHVQPRLSWEIMGVNLLMGYGCNAGARIVVTAIFNNVTNYPFRCEFIGNVLAFFIYSFFVSIAFVMCTGKLRYANNSNYKNDTMIRKEVSLSSKH